MLCDIQERFREVIWQFPGLAHTSKFLVSSAEALSIPVIATEQYPKAFLPTIQELRDAMSVGGDPQPTLAVEGKSPGLSCPAPQVFAKTKFSMCTEEVDTALSALDPNAAATRLLIVEAAGGLPPKLMSASRLMLPEYTCTTVTLL